MPDSPVDVFIEAARQAGRKIVPQGSHYLVSCPGPNHAHGDRNPSLHVSEARNGGCALKCFAGCDNRDIVDRVGLKMSDLFVPDPTWRPAGAAEPVDLAWVAAEYNYADAAGVVRYQVRRIEHLVGVKTFTQRRPNGRGGWVNNLEGVERVPYRLPELRAAIEAGRGVWYVEGEKDAETLIGLGRVATTVGAVNNWRDEMAAHFVGARGVRIVADRDTPGYTHARKVSAALEAVGVSTLIVEAAEGKDLTDHVRSGHELAELVEVKPDAQAPIIDDTPRRLDLVSLAGMQVRPVHWLWEHRIALGQIALLAGREGIGKSTAALTLAAQVTRGTLEGAYFGKPRAVVIVATEDSFEHTIGPRLMAADADLELVFRVTMTAEYAALAFPRDLPDLEAVCAARDVGLIVLDPLISRLGAELDSHKDGEVRQALEPLGMLADRIGASVLGLIHLNKGGSTDPLQSVMASKAFTAFARSVLFAMADPEQDGNRMLGLVKSNLGPEDVPTHTYRMEGVKVADTDEGPVWTGRIAWGPMTARGIRETLETAPGALSDIEAAARWLRTWLCQHGQVPASEVYAAALAATHKKHTLGRASKRVGVTIDKLGMPGVVYWRLTHVEPGQPCSPDDEAREEEASPARARAGGPYVSSQVISGEMSSAEITTNDRYGDGAELSSQARPSIDDVFGQDWPD